MKSSVLSIGYDVSSIKTVLGASGGSAKLICVIGARRASALRRYRGNVSSQVVAEASCNVTVLRARSANAEAAEIVT